MNSIIHGVLIGKNTLYGWIYAQGVNINNYEKKRMYPDNVINALYLAVCQLIMNKTVFYTYLIDLQLLTLNKLYYWDEREEKYLRLLEEN